MFVITPTSALHYTYPTCPADNHERAAEAAVHRAAYDYAVARARAEALCEREQERRYIEAVRRKQARDLVESIYEQQYPQHRQHAYGFPVFDEERYRERLRVEAARRRAALLRHRQEAERARLVALARQRAEAERKREVQRREQEHWLALLNSHFGSQKAEASTLRPTQPTPEPSTSKPEAPSVQSSLAHRLETESDPDMLETLQHLLWQLSPTPVDRKGKARETPVIPFSFAQTKPEEKIVPASTPSAPIEVPVAESEPVREASTPAEDTERSLETIRSIESTLHDLQSSFTFPAELDLSPRPSSPAPSSHSASDAETETDLAYTAKNRPVHAYEHALNGLLEKLDAVESFGDEEVRGRRRGVVGQVEEALREVGRRVEESRERERASGEVVVDAPAVDALVQEAGTAQVEDAVVESSAVADEIATAEPTVDLSSENNVPSAAPTPVATLSLVETSPLDSSAPTTSPADTAEHSPPLEAAAAEDSTPDTQLSEVTPDSAPTPASHTDESTPSSSSTPAPPPPAELDSFLLQPAQNPLPDHGSTLREGHAEPEDDVDLVDLSEGELKEWENVDSDGEL